MGIPRRRGQGQGDVIAGSCTTQSTPRSTDDAFTHPGKNCGWPLDLGISWCFTRTDITDKQKMKF